MPTGDQQIQANRRIALTSTGPTTPQGKRAVRHNALKDGPALRRTMNLPNTRIFMNLRNEPILGRPHATWPASHPQKCPYSSLTPSASAQNSLGTR